MQARELDDGLGVIVDAKVDEDVAEARVAAVALDHEQCGRLLSAPVAAGGLGGRQAVEQSLSEGSSLGRGERRRERRHGLLADEDVPLGGESRAGDATRPVHAGGSGVGRAASIGVDDAELAVVATVVGIGQPLHDLGCTEAFAEQLEAVAPIPWVGVGLGCDCAYVRLGPGDDRADGEELRLRGNAPLSRVEVARGDRVRRDDVLSHR